MNFIVVIMAINFLCSNIMTKKPSKNDAKQLSQYEQMQHHEALTTASQRSTSNYFLSHYEVKYLQHQNSRIV